jgi:transposase-like protein
MNLAKRKFAELHGLGWTYAEIAKVLGVTTRALFKWRKELGLPKRKRGRRLPKTGEIR